MQSDKMTDQLLQNQSAMQKVIRRSWRSNLKRDIIKMLSGLMSRFYKTGSIDMDTKDHFYKSLHTYEKHVAIFGTIDNKLEKFVPKAIVDAQLVILGLLFPIFLGVYLKQSILFIFASVIISIIVIFIFFVTMPWLLKILAQDKSLIWLIIFSVASFLNDFSFAKLEG